jgi:hypothetical protein
LIFGAFLPPRKKRPVCEAVHTGFCRRVICCGARKTLENRDMIYGGFEINSFEAGKGLWHARIQRADHAPVVIDGISFPALEVGFAWTDQEAAIADAKTLIDQFRQRPGMMPPSAEHQTSP